VSFRGRSDAGQIEVVIYREGREFRKLTVQPRRGDYELRTNLDEGRYEAYFSTKGRYQSQSERRVRFVVTEGRVRIERPDSGDRLSPGLIQIEGSADSEQVEVEITRGFDRVFVERVKVNNDSFVSRPKLDSGQYVVTVRSYEGKELMSTDKRGFTVGRGRDDNDGPVDLRLRTPFDRQQITDGSVEFEGTSSAKEVRIQIMRGRDQVQDKRISVRDGRFSTSFRLQPGRYEAVVTVQGRGRESIERKVSFNVGR
jgi:hypothetical protein